MSNVLDKTLVAISDLDHHEIDTETAALAEFGIEPAWFNCKTEDEIIQSCKGFKAIMNQYSLFTEKVFANLPDLKAVVRYGVGVDNIDLAAATKHGVKICNVPDYGMNEVADQAIAFMMALVRKIVLNNDNCKKGVWDYSLSKPIHRLSEQTVGVIGYGRIGEAFAKRAAAFGCRVIVSEAYAPRAEAIKDTVNLVSLDELLEQADVISIHCPADNNIDLIAATQLKKMKKSAYLINVSRGGIINEQDLFEALRDGEIAGAACDVFRPEPPQLKGNPLVEHPNFLVSPHIAWYSEEAAIELHRRVAQEAARAALGMPLENVVNK